MMFNKIKMIIILFLSITIIYPFRSIAALDNDGMLLIIYDDYKEYGSEINNLNYVLKMALTTGNNIELRKSTSYTTLDLNDAKGIIVLSNKEGSFNKDKLDEIYTRSEKLIWIGKNSFHSEVIPSKFNSLEDILNIKKRINDKFNNKKKTDRNCYIVIDEVYPYDDLNLLIKKADYLYNQGIPFLVSAMGVYENLELDAMKRYTEALRYCVSKGGNIVIGDPYIYNKGPTEDELISRVSIDQDGFINSKVYPIGLTINDYTLYRNDRKKYLNNTSTIIINESEKLGVINFEEYSISSFDNVLIKISNDEIGFEKHLLNDVAIGFKGRESFESFKEKIDGYKRSGMEFSNSVKMKSSITFGNNKVANGIGGITVNDVNVGGNKFIQNDKFTYEKESELEQENQQLDEGIDLSKSNNWIFIVTIISLIIFIILFIYGLKIDRKKYFK